MIVILSNQWDDQTYQKLYLGIPLHKLCQNLQKLENLEFFKIIFQDHIIF